MKQDLLSSVRATLVALLAFTVLTGIAYPLLVLGVSQLAFPRQANGSLLDGASSTLIGQPFTDPRYFWGRPSATGSFPYNAMSSSASNLGPSNPALHEAVAGRVAALRDVDPSNDAPVPVELVTTSASGLDPDISPAAAYYQAARVARRRGMAEADVRALIASQIEGRTLGILGEPRINVLALNRALDARKGEPPR